MKASIALIWILASVATAFVPTARVATITRPVAFSQVTALAPLQASPDTKDEASVVDEKVDEGNLSPDTKGEASVDEKDEEGNLNLMSKIKAAGAAGAVSLFLWELAFWAISIPVAIFAFVQVSGSFPDLSDKEDLAKVGGEAFAFANVARFALPVRIGLAVSTTPWVEENIVQAPWAAQIFKKKDGEEE
jgi:hypothetical protein